MQSMKETAANAGASAEAGLEKAKASVQEKVYNHLIFSFFPFKGFAI